MVSDVEFLALLMKFQTKRIQNPGYTKMAKLNHFKSCKVLQQGSALLGGNDLS